MRVRKKPVEVDAIQWTGENQDEISAFIGPTKFEYVFKNGNLEIHTLEGVMKADPLDYIIKGVKGEVYPCKPDIFEKSYDIVEG